MELIYARRVESSQWVTTLTPLMEQNLQNETSRARSLHLLPSYGNRYEVLYMVDVVDEYAVGQLKEYDGKKCIEMFNEIAENKEGLKLADIFTKFFSKFIFETLRDQLGVISKHLKEEC
ncbi:hypothetical protein P3S68_002929 [Capsicum galapagoense]